MFECDFLRLLFAFFWNFVLYFVCLLNSSYRTKIRRYIRLYYDSMDPTCINIFFFCCFILPLFALFGSFSVSIQSLTFKFIRFISQILLSVMKSLFFSFNFKSIDSQNYFFLHFFLFHFANEFHFGNKSRETKKKCSN